MGSVNLNRIKNIIKLNNYEHNYKIESRVSDI